jgi:hypothetical protein
VSTQLHCTCSSGLGFIRRVTTPPNHGTQKPARGRQKQPTFEIVPEAFQTAQYIKYFSPGGPVEHRMIGLKRDRGSNQEEVEVRYACSS